MAIKLQEGDLWVRDVHPGSGLYHVWIYRHKNWRSYAGWDIFQLREQCDARHLIQIEARPPIATYTGVYRPDPDTSSNHPPQDVPLETAKVAVPAEWTADPALLERFIDAVRRMGGGDMMRGVESVIDLADFLSNGDATMTWERLVSKRRRDEDTSGAPFQGDDPHTGLEENASS